MTEREEQRRNIRITSWVRILPDDITMKMKLAGRMARVEDIWGPHNDQLMLDISGCGLPTNLHINRVMLCHGGAKN